MLHCRVEKFGSVECSKSILLGRPHLRIPSYIPAGEREGVVLRGRDIWSTVCVSVLDLFEIDFFRSQSTSPPSSKVY